MEEFQQEYNSLLPLAKDLVQESDNLSQKTAQLSQNAEKLSERLSGLGKRMQKLNEIVCSSQILEDEFMKLYRRLRAKKARIQQPAAVQRSITSIEATSSEVISVTREVDSTSTDPSDTETRAPGDTNSKMPFRIKV